MNDISHATCEVVTLTLGPFQLEVLGIVFTVDPVVFTVDADPLGGLVGRWLCALAEASWLDLLVAPVSRLPALFGAF